MKNITKKWITNNFEKSEEYNNEKASYRLKHFVSNSCGEYNTNEDFIQIMEELGYKSKWTCPEKAEKVFKFIFKRKISEEEYNRKIY